MSGLSLGLKAKICGLGLEVQVLGLPALHLCFGLDLLCPVLALHLVALLTSLDSKKIELG